MIAAGIVCSLALGAIVTTGLLLAAYRSIHKRGRTFEWYYLHMDQQPHETPLFDKIMTYVYRGYGISFLFIILYFFSFVAAGVFLQGKEEALLDAIDILRNGISMLLPMTLGATALFATFKKPTYTLFNTRDVVRERKLLPRIFTATLAWLSAVIMQIAANLAPHNGTQSWKIIFLCFGLMLLVVAYVECFHVLFSSYQIIFSSETSELKLLNHLNERIHERDVYLKSVDCGNEAAVSIIDRYLVGQFRKRSIKFVKRFAHHPQFTQVEFWDSTDDAPLRGGWQILISFYQNLKMIFLFTFLCAVTVCIVARDRCLQLLNSAPEAFLTASLCVLLLLSFLYQECRPLQQMVRVQSYGRWGYRFLDETGRPCFYCSRRQLPYAKGPRWLDALFNILTLYRIELLNGYVQELPQTLLDTLSETDDERAAFLLKLAYYLCICLALESDSSSADVDSLLLQLLDTLGDTWSDSLLFSWASAIWVDIKRDPGWYAKRHRHSSTVFRHPDLMLS